MVTPLFTAPVSPSGLPEGHPNKVWTYIWYADDELDIPGSGTTAGSNQQTYEFEPGTTHTIKCQIVNQAEPINQYAESTITYIAPYCIIDPASADIDDPFGLST
jgi:hypothetical protein